MMRIGCMRRISVGIAMVAATAVSPEAAAESGSTDHILVSGYVVVLKEAPPSPDATVSSTVHSLTARHGGEAGAVWRHALRGFALTADKETAAAIARDPRVAYVQQDTVMRVAATQTPTPSWGLDRIDQRNRPLDNSYTYDTTASNVTAYVLDTGIRTTHTDFGGRAVFGVNTIGDGVDTDCNGHGTHVAGTVGGASHGVAKGVRLVSVKVLDCFGFGSVVSVISGVDWVAQHAVKPAVANMSLESGANEAIDDAVAGAINSGVTFAVASGNGSRDACGVSPARATAAITVNASDITDTEWSDSNYGVCTDLYAPGVGITSTWHTSDNATNTISGTSMASPHVTGAAALYLSANPEALPAEVSGAITVSATPNVIAGASPGSPNRILFSTNTIPPPTMTLSRYFNGFDHLSATDPPGGRYRLEGPLGRVNTTHTPGTHAIYQCRSGNDYFTSPTGHCEGQTVIGRLGFLHDNPPPRPSVLITRCVGIHNGEHFDSTTGNCEGQVVRGPLGYAER
jgi:subtilisin family serine protease